MSFTHRGKRYTEEAVTEAVAVRVLGEIGITLQGGSGRYTVLIDYQKRPGQQSTMTGEIASVERTPSDIEICIRIMPYFYGPAWQGQPALVGADCWCLVVEFLANTLRPRMSGGVVEVWR